MSIYKSFNSLPDSHVILEKEQKEQIEQIFQFLTGFSLWSFTEYDVKGMFFQFLTGFSPYLTLRRTMRY